MPALQPQPQITSLEQYEALPENVRAEVFDGQIYYMASPSQIHQTILTELLVSIRNYLRKKGGDCQVFPAPFDVKLSDRPLNIVQPDLMESGAMVLLISSLRLSLPAIRQMIISASSITTRMQEFVNTGL